MVINGQVGIFTHVDRAHPFVDSELHGWIQSDHFQRFVVRQAAILHALGGFLIEVRGFLRAVRINGNNHSAAGHQRRIVRNGVISFDFVRPPIRKSRSANSGSGKFVGHFVAFQNVLKGADLEAELLGHAEEHQDFVLAIAMRVHVALAFEHFHERLEFQVAARRNEIFFAGGNALVVVVPGFLVIARLAESAANGFLHAHACGRKAAGLAGNAEIRTLGVFAEGELNAGHRSFKR